MALALYNRYLTWYVLASLLTFKIVSIRIIALVKLRFDLVYDLTFHNSIKVQLFSEDFLGTPDTICRLNKGGLYLGNMLYDKQA